MRIAIAEVAQESDSFSPLVAELADFEAYGLYYGDEMLRALRGVGPIGGFLAEFDESPEPVTVAPILRAWGSAGGVISASAFQHLRERFVAGLRAALPLDAVLLSLHGAAASQLDDDVEGHLLQAAREIVGPETPIAVALDHHANITSRMMRHADLLVGHETQPHDPPATGRKTARLLRRWLHGEIQPVKAWRKIPMITPQDQFLTSAGPMREWFQLARSLESDPRVLDVSPYPMQPWLDVAEGGWSVVVHTNGDATLADKLAQQMHDCAWRLRDEFWRSERVPPDLAARQADDAPAGLIIVSDTGDSVYGGAPGDNTCVLHALHDAPLRNLAYAPLVDPAALATVVQAGVGATLTLELGGKIDCEFCQPLRATARVAAISSGFRVDLGDRGICDLRQTALLEIGAIRLVLLDHRSFAINHPILYTHLGLDMNDAQQVVVKTASNFQFFERWRRGLVRVDSPGTTQSNLRAFHWRHIPAGTYPLT